MSPTKLFAYMASGKIIIASDLPSVREIVDEGIVLFILPGNIDDLTKKIKNSLSSDSLCMSTKAHERASSFEWRERGIRILK
jgi:glycosyltransferase involved in cell wall biosynthesis